MDVTRPRNCEARRKRTCQLFLVGIGYNLLRVHGTQRADDKGVDVAALEMNRAIDVGDVRSLRMEGIDLRVVDAVDKATAGVWAEHRGDLRGAGEAATKQLLQGPVNVQPDLGVGPAPAVGRRLGAATGSNDVIIEVL